MKLLRLVGRCAITPSNMTNDHYKRMTDSARVYDVAIRSPLEQAVRLSNRLGCNILLKREDLQPVFSFKLRGAYNKLASLDAKQLQRGVICSSAGNHAQGVALAASKLGCRAVIVMPETTPSIKVNAVRGFGGEVVLFGDTYDDAQAHAKMLCDQQGLVFIHPFDDEAVIAGQGTIGKEILEQSATDIAAIFVPIGGGGLIAGIASYVKAVAPEVRIIGVEPDDSDAMRQALLAGHPVTLDHVGIFADGVAVKRVGDLTFAICRDFVDEVMTVSTDQISAGIRDIFEETRSIVEPAGGLAIAGIKLYARQHDLSGKTIVAINCGANVNFDRLRHIVERASFGEQTEMLLAVEIPEKPGSFRRFCKTLGKRSITEFNYRLHATNTAQIFVGIELRDGSEERDQVSANLAAAGYESLDLSDDELAKLHIRHMVGGRPDDTHDERLFRFEFPERPGALLKFLEAIGEDWNISLFHYRNHGSDYGRVLAGLIVPPQSAAALEDHLDELGYLYVEETANPAYQHFLR